MRNLRLLSLVLFLSLGCGSLGAADDSAELIFLNGNIYTVNHAQPHADAIAIKDKRIVFVGTNEQAEKFRGPTTRVLDLGGKTVVPGLTDSHYHIFGVGQRLLTPDFSSATSRPAFLEKVKELAALYDAWARRCGVVPWSTLKR